MARAKVDQEYYDKIVDAFRENPGVFIDVRQKTGVSRRTAKKAWDEGWPAKGFPPVKQTLELEALQSRKERTEAMDATIEALKKDKNIDEAATRAMARRDAIQARIEEGKMIKNARLSAIQLLESCKSIAASLADVAPKVATAIRSLDVTGMGTKELEGVVRLLWRLSSSTRAASSTAWDILRSERLLLGQPTDIIGVQDMDNMSETEAMTELEEAAKALERMKARQANRGNFHIIDGAKKANTP